MNPSPSSSGPSGGRPLTGKQLPLVRAVADPRSDPPESSSSTSLVTSWRLNDAVVGLQLARRQLTSKEFQSDSVTATSSTKMLVSNRFDDRVLRRSTFYKDEIVRKAFGAAATTILTAILLKSSAIPVDQSRTRDSNNETLGAIRSTKTTTAWYSDLPLSVQQQLTATPALPPNNNRNSGRDDGNINIDDSGHSRIRVRTLDQWRTYCLERSYENKEYTKRKGAKIDITSSSSSTPTTTTLRTNVLSKKTMSLPKKSDPKAKQTISTTPHETTSSSPMSIASTATTTTTKSQSGSKRTVQTAPANSSRSPTPASTSSVAADATPSSLSTSVAAPKFTRNTPASSAAALDGRLHTSRAIVCVAANICFDRLTPPFVPNSENDENDSLDLLNVPQNVNTKTITGSTHNAVDQQDDDDDRDPVNMGAVFLDAKILAQRVISTVENAVRRSKLRYQFRKDNARNDSAYPTRLLRESNKNISSYNNSDPVMVNYLKIDNPWSQLARSTVSDESDAENKSMDEEHVQNNNLLCHTAKEEIPYQPNPESITVAWQTLCLPRLLTVLDTGAGHAIYHDVEWSARHGRMADLLRSLSHPSKSDIDGIGDSTENWGPHLIVTTETELTRFAQEFVDYRSDLGLLIRSRTTSPRAMIYHGSKTHRRRLRKYFSKANGLLEAPFHVLITSYNSFVKDYLHFCQVPFETVIVDDGAAWMANKEQNRPSGTMWDMAIFSSNDHGVGLAGTSFKQWDFLEDDVPDAFVKETWIGLTTRHRVVTTSTMTLKQRTSTDCIPVSGLLDFVAPQFFAVVKEDWDRSKISASEPSMAHFRQLVARTMVVHSTDAPDMDLSILASQSLAGDLQSTDGSDIRSDNLVVPVVFSGEDFEEAGSLPFARRNSLLWLGPPKQSWLRYELGRSTFHHILEAMKVSTNFGYFCEEISTASSATTAGVTGQLTGSTAFRFGIRCGRHFGSESGLRQHISAQHAPPGTWLCRTCSSDCTTSQARTHHERTCGQLVLGTLLVLSLVLMNYVFCLQMRLFDQAQFVNLMRKGKQRQPSDPEEIKRVELVKRRRPKL